MSNTEQKIVRCEVGELFLVKTKSMLYNEDYHVGRLDRYRGRFAFYGGAVVIMMEDIEWMMMLKYANNFEEYNEFKAYHQNWKGKSDENA